MCKLFEDNSGAPTLAWALAMKPRTKHINVKYHQFCAYVANYTISTIPINSDKYIEYMLTHPFKNTYLYVI